MHPQSGLPTDTNISDLPKDTNSNLSYINISYRYIKSAFWGPDLFLLKKAPDFITFKKRRQGLTSQSHVMFNERDKTMSGQGLPYPMVVVNAKEMALVLALVMVTL